MGRSVRNWIEGYQQYTAGTESPDVFHLWVAIGTLGAAAQRKILMDADYYEVHSNQFIILTSPAGRSRKSTAIRIGKALLKSAMNYGAKINFSTQAGSVAGLVQQFLQIQNKEHQSLTGYISELGSLLGPKSVEMTDFLTDIYDCNPDWDKQTVSRSLEKIDRPWLNLICGTTPQWLGDNLSKTAIEGGYVSRSIFVYSKERKRVAFPKQTPEQKALGKLLAKDLAHIAELKGVFEFSPSAQKYYEDWYEDPERDIIEGDYRIAGFYERKHIHVLKAAMMLALAERDELVLEIPDIKAAIALLTSIEPGMRQAFRAVGKNVHGTTIERLRDMIAERGRIPYKRLVADFINDISREEFDKLLDALVQMGDVLIERVKDEKWICDAHLIRTEKILNEKIIG